MKTNNIFIKSFPYLLMGLILITGACKRTEFPDEGMAAPVAADVKFSATPKSANANIIDFKNESEGFKAIWDLGNGASGEGSTISGSYPEAGTYTVKLTIFTKGGYATTTKQVIIAQTNTSMLTGPDYDLLTGGAVSAAGKTWVVDKEKSGHLGVGPIGSGSAEWYNADPNEKATAGFYDDEMTFNTNGLKYTYKNNGTTFVNGANGAGLGGTVQANDFTVNFTPPTNMTWNFSQTGSQRFINISNNGFLAYYTGVSKFEIITLTENELYVKFADRANAGNAWWVRMVPKGYVHPVIPVEPKPLRAASLNDDFDANGNVTWLAENINYKRAYDNPAPVPINASAKVGFYAKMDGDNFQYGNLQTTLNHRFDLTTKNKIKLKVFIPGYNDFTKVNPKVAIKLQNSLLGGNSWTTQREVAHVITEFNKWIELEFDFSAFAADDVYDKIVVQLGGEGHPFPGIFYIDDFEFK
ncbi:PKD domain-containing protein [Pedobacter metabolipauper]|uniref:PKD domain-containing protein n=1 Tax=Pedobacter metabolipauper TaxID=425513 RepID=A0A4R6SQH9_9SPHI|nr:PKD domain-containing protein [Pedobacter metabolipauper]TDQ07001.1 hypothetical protein ATK78_4017 [Pedobacter metabolipauper]